MRKWNIVGAAFLVLSAVSIANAGSLTTTYQPNPTNLDNLDHHYAYTWRIDNINLTGQTITGAKLEIQGIRNWDSTPNMLFMHLLDTAKNSGVSSLSTPDPTPTSTGDVPTSQFIDDFATGRFNNNSNWLVAKGTADTFLTARSFTTTPTDFVFNFSASQLQALSSDIRNGDNVAFGFDPDCHFYNNGVKFEVTTQPSQATPEPSSMALVGIGCTGLFVHQRVRARRRRRSA